LTVISGLAWGAVSSLFYFLINHRLIVYFVQLFQILSFFVFFRFNIWYVLFLVALFVVMIFGYELIQSEKKARLKISLIKSIKAGFPLILFFVILLVLSAIYFNPPFKITKEGLDLPSSILQIVEKSFQNIFSRLFPIYSEDMTVDELVVILQALEEEPDLKFEPSSEFIKELKKRGLSEKIELNRLKEDPELENLFLKELKDFVLTHQNEVTSKREEIAKNFQLELKGNETLSEAILDNINSKLKQLPLNYQSYLKAILIVAVFTVLNIFALPFKYLVWIFSFIIFKLLLLLKIVKITQQRQNVEILEI